MPDVFTKQKRSEVMSRIKSSGNKDTELRLMKIFRRHRVTGWRRKFKLLGKPDFVFPKARVAVFVDGCFWHGCEKHCRMPSSNKKFWREKISRNRRRDLSVSGALRKSGWRVLRIWEHALSRKMEKRTVNRVWRALRVNSQS